MNAAFELKNQIEEGLLPEPDYIYIALGSAGTAAGLILGLKLAGLQSKVIPVRVSGTSSLSSRISYLLDRVHETSSFMHECDATCPQLSFLVLTMIVEVSDMRKLHPRRQLRYECCLTLKESSLMGPIRETPLLRFLVRPFFSGLKRVTITSSPLIERRTFHLQNLPPYPVRVL